MIYPSENLDGFDRKFDEDLSTETRTVRNPDPDEIEPLPRYSPRISDATLNTNTGILHKRKSSPEPLINFLPVSTPVVETQAVSGPSEDTGLKGSNFIYRHLYFDSICASYIIDPNFVQDPSQIILPDRSSTLANAKKGKLRKRKNLCLQSECGAIDVDVRVLNLEERGLLSSKVLLDFRTTFGPIDHLASYPPIQSIRPAPESVPNRLPINLSASSKCGPIHISLPPSFNGFIFLSVALGQIVLSPRVRNSVSWDSLLNGGASDTRTMFIGDSEVLNVRMAGIEGGSHENGDVTNKGHGPWVGDEVHLHAWCGSVLVDYVD
ncbi:hypothetical protein DFH05DRAFT_846613 [Lentinula detonsa]|uniref:DUF7330 domain-containing protein n=1 Tax=Lentinula detonsa TaxID=2804962 RepID=A0A9W8P658_9AGAR|nr:hypothetical protein DFH05DRAFT_846613 [Lentinula detonsa]